MTPTTKMEKGKMIHSVSLNNTANQDLIFLYYGEKFRVFYKWDLIESAKSMARYYKNAGFSNVRLRKATPDLIDQAIEEKENELKNMQIKNSSDLIMREQLVILINNLKMVQSRLW